MECDKCYKKCTYKDGKKCPCDYCIHGESFISTSICHECVYGECKYKKSNS